MSHEIGGADGSGAAAAVLAVHEAAAPGPHGLLDGGAAGLEEPGQVLGRVIEHGHADAAEAAQRGEGLLPGDIHAEGHPLPRQQLLVARCPGRAQQQRGRDRAELQHRRARGTHRPRWRRGAPGGGTATRAPPLCCADLTLLYLSFPTGSRQVLVPAASRELRLEN